MSYVFGNDSTSIPDHLVNPNFLKLNVEDTVDNPVLTPSLDIQDSPLPVPHDDISETSSQFNSGCKIKRNGDKIDKDTISVGAWTTRNCFRPSASLAVVLGTVGQGS